MVTTVPYQITTTQAEFFYDSNWSGDPEHSPVFGICSIGFTNTTGAARTFTLYTGNGLGGWSIVDLIICPDDESVVRQYSVPVRCVESKFKLHVDSEASSGYSASTTYLSMRMVRL